LSVTSGAATIRGAGEVMGGLLIGLM
jgi:hypothetical protein